MKLLRFWGLSLLFVLAACGKPAPQQIVYEYYSPSYRQLPPEPVYSRYTWAHLPNPVALKSKETAPLLNPIISFELPNSNFGEAVEALAQTIGYSWHYPDRYARRPVSVNMSGTADEILEEIGKQAKVETVLDHGRRAVTVLEDKVNPSLPGEWGSEGSK